MEYIFMGQFQQKTKKIIITNIESSNADLIINNVKPGNWNVWKRTIKKNFFDEFIILHCDGDILINHDLADYCDPNNWIMENTIFCDAELLIIYDEKYYNQLINQRDEEIEPDLYTNGVGISCDYCAGNDIFLSKKKNKIVGIKITQRESNGSIDDSNDENNIMCGIAGCFNDYTEYTSCCHEPVCKKHFKEYACHVKSCDDNDTYCEICAGANGYICNDCDKFFCDEHNTKKYLCKCNKKN
jgi:hypothetical protein